MKRKINNKKIIKCLIISSLLFYICGIFINQQKTLNSYETSRKYNEQKLQEVKEHQESLLAMKENINSDEYIEKIARENLDMYLPNEKIYMDISK